MKNSYEDIIKHMEGFEKFKENPDLLSVASLLLKDTICKGEIDRQRLKENIILFMNADNNIRYRINSEDFIFKHRNGTDNRAGIGTLISKVRINNSISKQMFILINELEKCKLEQSNPASLMFDVSV
jgi:hypothetical protein